MLNKQNLMCSEKIMQMLFKLHYYFIVAEQMKASSFHTV